MSDNKPNLRVNELAKVLEETPHIVRNWLRDYREWIPTIKAGNGYNEFPPEAVEKMLLIKRLTREQGFSTRQISHHLATGERIGGGSSAAEPAATKSEVAELKEMIRKLTDEQEKQNDLSRAILSKMDEREKIITQFITERKESAAARQLEAPKNRPWWRWWGSE